MVYAMECLAPGGERGRDEAGVFGLMSKSLAGSDSLQREKLLSEFERSVAALWARAHFSLADATLRAVFERVIEDAARIHAAVRGAEVISGGVRLPRERLGRLGFSAAGLRLSFQSVLAELVGVLGMLTGQILTAPLYAALAEIAPLTLESRSGLHGQPAA